MSLIMLSMVLGCQAQIVDSDEDGWDDEREAVEGTNPNNMDSDEDGFSDPRDWEPINAFANRL